MSRARLKLILIIILLAMVDISHAMETTLSWTCKLERTDGTPMTTDEFTHHKIYWWDADQDGLVESQSIKVANEGECEYVEQVTTPDTDKDRTFGVKPTAIDGVGGTIQGAISNLVVIKADEKPPVKLAPPGSVNNLQVNTNSININNLSVTVY